MTGGGRTDAGVADVPGRTGKTGAAAWQGLPEGQAERATRATALTIALVLLAAACVTAFVSALRIASIWFEPRFVPVAHLAVAGAVVAACVAVVRRLRRPG